MAGIPMLPLDSHWGLESQVAYREASVTWSEAEISRSSDGSDFSATWSATHVGGRFTRSSQV